MIELDQRFLERVLATALSGGGDYAEVFAERTVTRMLEFEAQTVQRATAGSTNGVAVRLVAGGTSILAIAAGPEDEWLLEAARTVAGASAAASTDRRIDLRRMDPRIMPVIDIPFSDRDAAAKTQLIASADRAARAESQHLSQVRIQYREQSRRFMVANSDGHQTVDDRNYLHLVIHAIATHNGQVQSGLGSFGLQRGLESLENGAAEELAKKAARQAEVNLDARPAPAGRMTVVLRYGWGGVLFHEACGHGLEADSIKTGASVYAGKIGQQVASPLVTAIDDPTMPGEWGSFGYDDEGTPSSRTVLIENGILRGYMHTKATAGELAGAVSANARRESFEFTPLPRMSNTFIAPGSSTHDEIISATEHGLYAKDLRGGQVNPATGDFVFSVSEGYMIRNGRLAEPVRGAALIGNGPQVLNRIDMIGSDFGLAPGMCGKMDQSVPTSCGQPTLRISEMTVGGTEQGGR